MTDHGLSTQRRTIVEGVTKGRGWIEHSPLYGDPTAELERWHRRIANPPAEDWQPKILRVTIEERAVTPYVEIASTDDEDAK